MSALTSSVRESCLRYLVEVLQNDGLTVDDRLERAGAVLRVLDACRALERQEQKKW